jgi:hypothetical protein
MDEGLEIYLCDLKEEVQEEVIQYLGDNGNYDVYPIAVIMKGEDE